MKWIIALLPFLMQTTHAVTVNDCPAKIQVTFDKLDVLRSEQKVVAALNGTGIIEAEKISAVKALLPQLKNSTFKLDFRFKDGARGRCTYENMNAAGSQEKAVLYTKKGSDTLLVQTTVADQGILLRAYIPIQEVTTDGLYLAELDSSLAIAVPRHGYVNYGVGGPLIFIGKVSELNVD